MSPIRTGKPLVPQISSSGPSSAADLPSDDRTVQFPRITPEAHPPRSLGFQ